MIKENALNKNSNEKIDAINNKAKLFNRLQNLQTLIKKESSLKELCKNHKLIIFFNIYIT